MRVLQRGLLIFWIHYSNCIDYLDDDGDLALVEELRAIGVLVHQCLQMEITVGLDCGSRHSDSAILVVVL